MFLVLAPPGALRISLMTYRLAAIVSLDLAGYSAASEANEDAAIAAVGALRDRVSQASTTFPGRVFHRAGDGFMLEFSGVRTAAGFSLALLKDYQGDAAGRGIRLGLHFGEVQVGDDGDLLGHAVNVAARLQALARLNTLLASHEAASQLLANPQVAVVRAGRQRLNKMTTRMETFELRDASAGAGAGAGAGPAKFHSRRKLVLAGLGLSVVAAASTAAIWSIASRDDQKVLAVFPFKDSAGAETGGDLLFPRALSSRLTQILSRAPGFILISDESLGLVADLPRQDAALRLQADYVLSGDITVDDGSFELQAVMWRAQTLDVVYRDTVRGQVNGADAAITDIATAVLSHLGVAGDVPNVAAGSSDPRLIGLLNEAFGLLREDSIIALDRANQQFQQAVLLAPYHEPACTGLGESWLALLARASNENQRSRMLVEAKLAAGRAVFLDSRSGEALALLADVHAQAGRWIEADAAISQAVLLSPSGGAVRHHAATVNAKFGFLDRSREQIRLALTSDPLSRRILKDWALTHILAGKADVVSQYLRQNLDGDTFVWLDALALFEMGDPVRAYDLVANKPGISAAFRSWMQTAAAENSGASLSADTGGSIPDLPDRPFWISKLVTLGKIAEAAAGLQTLIRPARDLSALIEFPVEWLFLPSLQPLREHNDVREVFARIGLIEFWKRRGPPDLKGWQPSWLA